MSVLLYSFLDDETAGGAAAQLTGHLSLAPGDVSLGVHAQMGTVRDGLSLLAAVVEVGSIDTAMVILEGAGGTFVEQW